MSSRTTSGVASSCFLCNIRTVSWPAGGACCFLMKLVTESELDFAVLAVSSAVFAWMRYSQLLASCSSRSASASSRACNRVQYQRCRTKATFVHDPCMDYISILVRYGLYNTTWACGWICGTLVGRCHTRVFPIHRTSKARKNPNPPSHSSSPSRTVPGVRLAPITGNAYRVPTLDRKNTLPLSSTSRRQRVPSHLRDTA